MLEMAEEQIISPLMARTEVLHLEVERA